MFASLFRLLAATHTPFRPDGDLDLDAVEKQAQWLARTGVDGAFVAGTTGEYSSLTTAERIALTDRWCAVARPTDLEVIIHVGHTCQSQASHLAAHAQARGADAVAALAPCYFKPQTVDELIEFLVPVAEAASDLPFYYYDIPVMTGVRLPMVEFLEKGKLRMPNLVGLKYSNDDIVQLQECVQLQDGEFELLYGRDEALLAGVSLGACGAVGSTYNFVAPLYRQMLAALDVGEWKAARASQARSVQIVRTLVGYGFLAASKALMGMLDVECGPVRPPLSNLTPDQHADLERAVAELELEKDPAPPKPKSANAT